MKYIFVFYMVFIRACSTYFFESKYHTYIVLQEFKVVFHNSKTLTRV